MAERVLPEPLTPNAHSMKESAASPTGMPTTCSLPFLFTVPRGMSDPGDNGSNVGNSMRVFALGASSVSRLAMSLGGGASNTPRWSYRQALALSIPAPVSHIRSKSQSWSLPYYEPVVVG